MAPGPCLLRPLRGPGLLRPPRGPCSLRLMSARLAPISSCVRTSPRARVRVTDLAEQYDVAAEEVLSLCTRMGIGADDAGSALNAVEAARLAAALEQEGAGSRREAAAGAVPAMGSVMGESVRLRTVLAVALIIVSVAAAIGVAMARYLEDQPGSLPSGCVTCTTNVDTAA